MLSPISGLPLEALGVDAQRSLHNGSTACWQCLFSQREDVLALMVDYQLQMLQCRYHILLLDARKVANPVNADLGPFLIVSRDYNNKNLENGLRPVGPVQQQPHFRKWLLRRASLALKLGELITFLLRREEWP